MYNIIYYRYMCSWRCKEWGVSFESSRFSRVCNKTENVKQVNIVIPGFLTGGSRLRKSLGGYHGSP